MTTAPHLSETDLATALSALLPAEASVQGDIDAGEPFGAAYLALGVLAASRIPVPAELVRDCRAMWSDEAGDPLADELLARLGRVRVAPATAA